MKPIVAIIAQGAMGSGVARRLAEHGIEVHTSRAGRSESSASRTDALRSFLAQWSSGRA